MNKLNDKQIEFCEHYLKNGHNAKDAYSSAYPKASAKSAQSNAARLMENDDVKEYIKSKQIETAQRNNITKDQILAVVNDIMNNSEYKPNDRISAAQTLLKALGFNEPDKIENSGSIENKIIKIKYKKDEE